MQRYLTKVKKEPVLERGPSRLRALQAVSSLMSPVTREGPGHAQAWWSRRLTYTRRPCSSVHQEQEKEEEEELDEQQEEEEEVVVVVLYTCGISSAPPDTWPLVRHLLVSVCRNSRLFSLIKMSPANYLLPIGTPRAASRPRGRYMKADIYSKVNKGSVNRQGTTKMSLKPSSGRPGPTLKPSRNCATEATLMHDY
ncbi:hypothetical protein E2C01_015581 [Portunus trituberculatus]|uniref:Uncharacterized protein n=1 Tax=Portunus trituberculatus TaxID=210409 RepID=A0A5B7DMZ6_PORTR|nr:hypothetical protein [Portunus trituberculatus]